MKKGELSEFTISHEYAYGERGMPPSIPAEATLIFEVELINYYDKVKSKWEMDTPEKIAIAGKIKDEGVALFKEKKFAEASAKFVEGLGYLDNLMEKDITDDVKDKRLSFLLNISNCSNNLKQYGSTIKSIGEALKIKEVPKCYYYRGQAFMFTDLFDAAQEDFKKLGSLLPGDETAKQCLQQLEQRKLTHQKKEKSLFKSFMKSSIYEDIPNKELPKEFTIPTEVDPTNPIVFFDISIGDGESKRVEFELFKNIVPKTAENFRSLCVGDKKEGNMNLHFKNSIFHRCIKNFMIQGGDFENANGTGGSSIYGRKFDDENFSYKHTQEGLLSMANSGANTNGSQFFVTVKDTNWLDGKHVVFGRVIKGMEHIKEIELTPCDSQDKPNSAVTITDCGVLEN